MQTRKSHCATPLGDEGGVYAAGRGSQAVVYVLVAAPPRPGHVARHVCVQRILHLSPARHSQSQHCTRTVYT